LPRRIEDRYTITSPVAAFVRRIEVEVGDRVDAGTPVARLELAGSAIDPSDHDAMVELLGLDDRPVRRP
jgi:pyruvate/2-oxoglutarate dehydrogenase complex dihydrolipoamide acyltransferase (E2) component